VDAGQRNPGEGDFLEGEQRRLCFEAGAAGVGVIRRRRKGWGKAKNLGER